MLRQLGRAFLLSGATTFGILHTSRMGNSATTPSLVDSLLIAQGLEPTAGKGGIALALRKAEIFSVATRVVADYKLLTWRCDQIEDDALKDELWEIAHERNAKYLYSKFSKLEALWLKLGQYLSSRADVMPQAFIRELAKCQDSLPAPSWEQTRQTIESDYGKPLGEIFKSIENVPLATASIASVYRAVLLDGTEVVVKVRHENVAERLLQDLNCLETIGTTVKWLDKDFDFSPVIREWSKEVPAELDFRREAQNMVRVARNLAEWKDLGSPLSVDVTLPTVLLPATERVLVMSLIDGFKINDMARLDLLGVDREFVVREVTKAYAVQIFNNGFFSADPHPGNLLVQAGKPVLLDFGLTKSITPEVQKNFCRMLVASEESDIHGLLSALEGVGLKLRTDVPFDVALLSKYFFRQANSASEAREENAKRRAEWKEKAEARARVLYVGDSVDATSKNSLGWKTSRKGEVVESNEGNLLIKFIDDTTAWYTRDQCKLQKTRSPIDGWPDAFIFFERVLGLLRGLTASLDVKQSFIETLGPYARETLRRMSQQDSETAELVEGTDKLGGKVTRIVQDALKSKNMLGVQVCVLRSKEPGRTSSASCAPRVTTGGTETLVDIYAGVANPYTLASVSSDTLFCSFSTSKAVAAAVVHQLVDDGLISLSDPIAKHWPEFAANGKGKITIQDVLAHRSGLQAAGTEEITTDPFLCTNSKAMTALMAASTPDPATLGETHYHYLSFGWILEGLIEAVSGGKSIRDLAGKLWGLRIGLSSQSSVKDDELATLVLQRFEIPTNAPGADNATTTTTTTSSSARRPAELASLLLNPTFFNNPRIQESSIPSANGFFTARGLAEFFISSGPRLADVLKSTNETASTTGEKLLQGGAGKFRGGFMLYDEDPTSITFGHSGLGGSIAVCRRNVVTGETIAVAVTLNRLQLDAKTTRLIIRTVLTQLGIRVPPAFVRD